MKNKPNFVLIFPDQWRGDCLSYLDHYAVHTPFIDKIAENGVIFSAAYSEAPTCIPARACLATGQTPSTCGRLGFKNGVPWKYETTFMKCLRDSGYQTLCSGKTHFYPERVALGFEEMRRYDVSNVSGDFESDYHAWLDRETKGMVRDTAKDIDPNGFVTKPWLYPEYLHPNTWTVDSAIELLSRRDPTRPFFIQVGFQRPHLPNDPPVEYYNMYKDRELPPPPIGDWVDKKNIKYSPEAVDRVRRGYFAQIEHIDMQIGRLLNWVDFSKEAEDTFVIFISDHGEMLGDHGMDHKRKPFEGSAKIPYIIMPPKNLDCKKGVTSKEPVVLMDIMPTLLEFVGINIPDSVEGLSLKDLITGSDNKLKREFIHGEHADINDGWQFVTDGKEKFIWESKSGREWFFDLVKDPREEKDLSTEEKYAERINLWRNRLIGILSKRPQDGLSDGSRLIPGKVLPEVRPELLNM